MYVGGADQHTMAVIKLLKALCLDHICKSMTNTDCDMGSSVRRLKSVRLHYRVYIRLPVPSRTPSVLCPIFVGVVCLQERLRRRVVWMYAWLALVA